MTLKNRSEVLVVGAGPVGLFSALSLVERGIEVQIIDTQRWTAARSYALALHPGSLKLLGELGLAEELADRGHRIHKLAFYDPFERRAELDFSRLPGDDPHVLVLPQQDLEDVLVRRLAKHGVRVAWNHRLADLSQSGRQINATIEELGKEGTGYSVADSPLRVRETFPVSARFLFGADGYHSQTRAALDIPFEKVADSQFFAVFEFGAEAVPDDEQRVILGEKTDVLWPMGKKKARFSFELEDVWEFIPDTRTKTRLAVRVGHQTFPYLQEETFSELRETRAPWFEAEVGEITWSVAVRFETRLARSFAHQRVWLAGDAAHLASPVGVHSMNVGLREAHDFASSIVEIERRGASLSLLEEQAAKHRSTWQEVLVGAFPARPEASDWVRKNAFRLAPTIPAYGSDLRHLLLQLGLEAQLEAA